ncbi:MAG: tRNA dihydrouridine synthase DusB [Myxococcota bacterium]
MDASAEASAIHPISLSHRRLENNLVAAPMAGVSNLPFRLIAREAGAALTFTETVSAKGLVMGGPRTRRLLRSSTREEPVAFQLFGSEPEILAAACRILETEEGATWVDLNMGCPVRKFIRNRAGSALMRDPADAARIVAAMRRSFSGTLSVKMRSGWDEASRNAPELARRCVAEGAEMISVHGRTRAQQYTGKADREIIRRVVESVPETPVLANGDVTRPEDVFSILRETGAAGVMVGRGCLGNPWIFEHALAQAAGLSWRSPNPLERWRTVERHIDLMRACFTDEASRAHNLKKYLTAYSKGLPGASEFRLRVNRSESEDELLETTGRFFQELRDAA